MAEITPLLAPAHVRPQEKPLDAAGFGQFQTSTGQEPDPLGTLVSVQRGHVEVTALKPVKTG